MTENPREAYRSTRQERHPEELHSEIDHREQIGVRDHPSFQSTPVIDDPFEGSPDLTSKEKSSVNHSDDPEVREAISCLLALIPQVTGQPPTRVVITPAGVHVDAHVYLTGESIRRVYGRGARTHEAFRRLSGAISGRMGQSIRFRFHEVQEVPHTKEERHHDYKRDSTSNPW